MTTEITLKRADIEDAERLNLLINEAYRGEEGWTRETEIVNGQRSSVDGIRALIKRPDSHLLVATISDALAACICVEEKEDKACIGTFAVSPELQNQGIGHRVLKLAESYAVNDLGYQYIEMLVISQREELIAFYERRGYKRSGKRSAYPVHLNVGIPAVEGLSIERLEKIT
ncbi:GNAT family N-acetyltransferase [Marinobacteraceae bacterium S3BR75-40.1]